MSKSPRMSKLFSSVLAGTVLLLVQVASSSADTPSVGNAADAGNYGPAGDRALVDGGYASEVPREAIDNQNQSTLAADKDEQSIPVAEEIAFVTDNSFRKTFEESLKTVAKVDYYGTRYVDCEQYPLEVHTAQPNQVRLLMKTGDSSTFEGSKKAANRTSASRFAVRRRDLGSSNSGHCSQHSISIRRSSDWKRTHMPSSPSAWRNCPEC